MKGKFKVGAKTELRDTPKIILMRAGLKQNSSPLLSEPPPFARFLTDGK